MGVAWGLTLLAVAVGAVGFSFLAWGGFRILAEQLGTAVASMSVGVGSIMVAGVLLWLVQRQNR